MEKLLTIGMAVYDDFDGLYFTMQSLRLYHEICRTNNVEFIVIDNNPSSKSGKACKHFCSFVNNCQYIPYTTKQSTAVRNEVFKISNSQYTICLDSHVMILPDGITKLLEYFKHYPDCKDIVHGPLVYDHLNLQNCSTHFEPVWSHAMYGRWATNTTGLLSGEAFEIPMQGLGLFACKTSNWMGFNKYFKGFGGEEGYIHEKFRMAGGKAICLPGLKWIHRFDRPNGIKYPLILEDRIWNYFAGWLELTQDPNHEMIHGAYHHFKEKIPPGSIDVILNQAINKMII
jgi:hypothetical protein